MVTKMADELDRVRISAAELRAEASSLITNKGDFKEVQEISKKQRQREGKRPDLQRYQPGVGQTRRRKDCAEGEGQALSSERAHTSSERVSDPDIKMHGGSPSGSDVNLINRDCQSGPSDFNTDGSKDTINHLHAGRSPVKDMMSSSGTPRSPKLSRKIRKPDREIYQPGGRRSQGSRDSGLNRELSKEVVKATGGLVEQAKDVHVEDVKEKEEKGKVKKSKDGRRKQELEKRQKNLESLSTHNGLTGVEKVTEKVENLNISSPTILESQEKKGPKAEDCGNRKKKLSSEGRRSRAGGGGEGGSCDGDERKKERGNRRSRGGRERGSGRRENGEGREKSTTTNQVEENGERTSEGGLHWDMKGKDGGQDQNVQHGKRRSSRASEGADANRVSSASKRYSKSDVRRPRNRTYSTSSASSGASMEAAGGTERRRANVAPGGRERGEGGLGLRSDEAMLEVKGGPSWSLHRPKRWTAKDTSSTDSLEEGEAWDRDDGSRGMRGREGKDDGRAFKTSKGNSRGLRGPLGSGRGGILRVSLDKQSYSAMGAGEDQTKRKNQGPRGRGRGILVLPAHTELTATPEPGPRLMGGMRGAVDLGRGRGGRGGSTRRLWDPNNPDKKPALAGSQQSQRSPLQQSLYLQHQGGCGPLHFLDTDDETTGSPPVPQGDHFQSQQAAAMAYYKFQNSDNPYCYPLPPNAPNTPPRYAYPYQFSYQMPASNGVYPSSAMAPFYGTYGQGYPSAGGTTISQEEAELQTRGELGKLLRLADSQELQLSNLLSRERLSPDGLDRMAQLRAELLTLYERVILTDIEFSDSQNLDQVLWKNVFYQVIERFRQLLKDQDSDAAVQIRTMLLTLLEEGAAFFDSLLQKLQTVFQFKLEEYMDGMAVRARPLCKTVKYALISAQRCMICQGDIARYREQASDSANYGKARSWYLKAQQIAPKNGRPYNQLALLAVYTKRKLDAVYYYMRSLAASNPILTAKESLMSLFEEAKRKAEQIECRRKQDLEAGARGSRGRGGARGEDATRVEIWIRPSGHPGVASRPAGSESELNAGLNALPASDLNKRFILSFLHTHGKLFTKVGMESFPAVASHVLQEFRALLRHSPSPLGTARMLQIVTINMFTIHYAQTRAEGQEDARSVLEEQATSLGLAMFGLLVQRCTEILKETPAEPVPVDELGEAEEDSEHMVRVSAFPTDLRELLPSVKVWSDWMLGHPEQWNPPPCNIDGSPDVWYCLAELCNALACVYHGETPLYKADGDGEEELRLLVLEEDRVLAGFIPLLAAPQEPCYTDPQTDTAMAADCKRVTVLKYFLEALCGQEEPLLAFKGGKYVSVAEPPSPRQTEGKGHAQVPEKNQQEDDVIVEEDVIVEDSSLSASEGEMDGDESEDDIRELRARRHVLTHKLAQQQKRRDRIQAVLQTGGQLELEIRPFYLVPDTNCFIDHLGGLRELLACGTYILVVPLIVITELDGLAKGLEIRDGDPASVSMAAHARLVQEQAKAAVAFLEKGFEAREPGLRALTSRGSQLDSIAFRSEDTSGQKGNNDDVILSCCLHYCRDKAKDFMPVQRDGPVRLRREVVLLTDDRNLRVKALTRNVPVRDIPTFLSWAKVG